MHGVLFDREAREGINTAKQRILWLDFVRSFAILSVVLMHCTDRIYNMESDDILSLGVFSAVFSDICSALGRLGVPLFLMLTGYLLLDRDYSSSEKIFAFYKHNLLPLVITCEAWILIYGVILFNSSSVDYQAVDLVNNMLFLSSHHYGHMWYIPVIIGIYIVLPFVSNAVKKISLKALSVPLVFAFALFFVFRFLSLAQDALGWQIALSSKLDTAFLGGVYGFYVLMGLVCKRGGFKKIPGFAVSLLFLMMFVLSAATEYYFRTIGYEYHLWYDYLPLMICGVCAFERLSRVNFNKKAFKSLVPAAASVSKTAFAIFFIHVPVRNWLEPAVEGFGLSLPLTVVIYFVAVFLLSAAAAFAVSKIPLVNKVLANVKS